MRPTLASLSLALLASCVDGPIQEQELLPPSECAIAVVASDYASSTVSLLTSDGRPCTRDLIHSGSRPPGLLTAISGDVDLPSAALGELVLIDRYPNGVLSLITPDVRPVAVRAQISAAPGFAGNPQDVLFLADGTALVTRLEHAPAGADTTPPPDGSDVLVIDPTDGSIRGRIDLADAADPGFDPMPTRMVAIEDRVWIGLTHMRRGFDEAGPGRLVAVDPHGRALADVARLDEFVNCGHIALAPSETGARAPGFWVVCSGLFARAGAQQIERSGLAFVSAAGEVAWQAGASTLATRPLSFVTLAPLDDTRVLVVAIGDLVENTPDRLLLVDRATHETRDVLTSGPFEIGQALVSTSAGLVLVAIADRVSPRIERLTLPALQPETPIDDFSATGLPPRALAFFRE